MFKIGDLVKCANTFRLDGEGTLGMVVGIDYDPRLHSFPMYVVMFADTGRTLWFHPNDIEGVSLVNIRVAGKAITGEQG